MLGSQRLNHYADRRELLADHLFYDRLRTRHRGRGHAMTNSRLAVICLSFFIIGVMAGTLAVRAIFTITPIIPREQLLQNTCPRPAGNDAVMWCTGPGFSN
jgi:hypothetical protein